MTIHIVLDNRYVLSNDSLQYIIYLDGRATYFYRTIEEALHSYLNMKIRGCEAKKISDLKQYIERQKKAITEAVSNAQHTSNKELGGQK